MRAPSRDTAIPGTTLLILSLAACSDDGDGTDGNGDGDGDGDSIVGDWDLASLLYDGQLYTYPEVLDAEYGCTYTYTAFMSIADDLSGELVYRFESTGCDDPEYNYTEDEPYPAVATEVAGGWDVEVEFEGELELAFTCPTPEGSEMLCTLDADEWSFVRQ